MLHYVTSSAKMSVSFIVRVGRCLYKFWLFCRAIKAKTRNRTIFCTKVGGGHVTHLRQEESPTDVVSKAKGFEGQP